MPFWIGVFVLLAIICYWTVLDTIRKPTDCSSKDPKSSALLVLRSLDTSSKKIKSLLLITTFQTDESLIVKAVTQGSEPNTTNYDPALKLPEVTASPTPSQPSPSPSPAASQPSPSPTPTEPSTSPHPWHELSIPYESYSFMYPFEQYVLNIHFDYKDKDKRPIPIRVVVVNQIDEAIIIDKCGTGYTFNNNSVERNSFNFVLERHRFIRATAGILYLVAISFLYYIATREEVTKVLTNSLGYLAALWGIRGIVVGSSKLFPTAVDFATLALYVAVVVILVYKWLFPPSPLDKGYMDYD